MRANKFKFKSSSEGFSLLELLIVIAIIIIMSAIALGAFFQTRLYAPEDQALKVMEFFRNATQTAITRRQMMKVEFNYPEVGSGAPTMGLFVGTTPTLVDYKPLDPKVRLSLPVSVAAGGPNPPGYTNYSGSGSWVAYFNADGTVVAAPGDVAPTNATFYFSTTEEDKSTLCAVTLFGGNGALSLWRYSGTSCSDNNFWCRR
jgi:prepilin-type N-terminal cleavage/methylation domain-containing protein